MSLGLARSKELQKRRSQRFWAIVKFVFIIGVIISVGYYAMQFGAKISLEENKSLKARFSQQQEEYEKISMDLGNNRAALEKLEKLLPSQEIQDLLVVINHQVGNGIEPARMERLISGLTKDENCAAEVASKRFIIQTPVSQVMDGSVSFDKGLISLSGRGSPTLNEEGNPEAWFDVQKPISITFTLPGGEAQEATGNLPFFHSILIKDTEYRFSITAGRRAYADVTLRICRLN